MNRPVRAMIAGIPNVGKSTFINSFAGKAVAKTGNKPGVTKGKQWIRLNGNVELLDTPGILWPKFEDQQIGRRLAVLGSIRDELQDFQELGLWLADYLRERLSEKRRNPGYGTRRAASDRRLPEREAGKAFSGAALRTGRWAGIFRRPAQKECSSGSRERSRYISQSAEKREQP